jgi:L-rhamnose isomerase/sugar isomerase
MDQATAKKQLLRQRIEIPSWGFANSGTRFGTFPQPGAARTLHDKLDDAATVHRFTGITPTVALHIPWDGTPDDDWDAVKAYADERGIVIGSINPNVFQDQCYKYGSFGNPDAAVRQKAIQAHLDCCAVAKATGSDTLSLWYADGTNYPGQDDFRARKRRFEACLAEVYSALPSGVRMLVEYKFFEPAFYHTDIPDWGSSLLLCSKLGPAAQVLVDTGHHPQGTNIEHIVATLLDEGKLGGFHFNSRKYADDDLTVGSIDPYELFLIFVELVKGANDTDEEVRSAASRVAYMFDQCHNLKHKIEATIQSALFVQQTYAKALLVDYAALSQAQAACDLLSAEEILRDAFHADVRSLLKEVRSELGVATDPIAAYRASGEKERAAEERQARAGGLAVGSGFQ